MSFPFPRLLLFFAVSMSSSLHYSSHVASVCRFPYHGSCCSLQYLCRISHTLYVLLSALLFSHSFCMFISLTKALVVLYSVYVVLVTPLCPPLSITLLTKLLYVVSLSTALVVLCSVYVLLQALLFSRSFCMSFPLPRLLLFFAVSMSY